MPTGPADHNLLKQINSALILDHLLTQSPQSRANLAHLTGLNRSTISSLVSELIAQGLVREVGLETAESRGRPGILLELNPAGGCIIGIEMQAEHVVVILTDFTARILWQRQVDIDRGLPQDEVLARADDLIAAAIRAGQANQLKLLGIGLGVSGLVDADQGVLMFAPNLSWRNINFRERWEARFGVPLYIENDGTAAALGEYYFGVAKGCDNFIYLGTGVGLAGGLMINGKTYRGAGGFAGELGHIIVESGGELCACGRRGCWETLISTPAVMRGIVHALDNGAPSLIPQLVGGDYARLTMQLVVSAANQGDRLAQDTLSDVALHLGTGIANLINIFNPEMIVLGGSLTAAGHYLLPPINAIIQAEALAAPARMVALALSSQGTYASVKGAIALVIEGIVRDPIA